MTRFGRKARHRASGDVHEIITEEHYREPSKDRHWAYVCGPQMNNEQLAAAYDFSEDLTDVVPSHILSEGT